MATYRNIQLSFWTDAKVADEFTPEDKYFYLYLLTNPHTNICGCYEISIRQMSIETGYSQETVERLLIRFALVHNIVRYSKVNKEILVINWHKYNWTRSEKVKISIKNAIKFIKTKSYKEYLTDCFECFVDDREIGEPISEDEPIESDEGIPEEDTQEEEPEGEPAEEPPKKAPKSQPIKHIFGEYKHVRLTDAQYERLVKEFGEEATLRAIKKVDEYCQEHGKTYVDYNLTIRKWGIEKPKNKSDPTPDTGQVRRTLQ